MVFTHVIQGIFAGIETIVSGSTQKDMDKWIMQIHLNYGITSGPFY